VSSAHARVDLDVCIVSGSCEAAVPALFALDPDGRVQVLRDPVPEDLLAQARAAAASCPSRALRLQEALER
jgi:ferredoxin